VWKKIIKNWKIIIIVLIIFAFLWSIMCLFFLINSQKKSKNPQDPHQKFYLDNLKFEEIDVGGFEILDSTILWIYKSKVKSKFNWKNARVIWITNYFKNPSFEKKLYSIIKEKKKIINVEIINIEFWKYSNDIVEFGATNSVDINYELTSSLETK
jgi:hypothetical protein